LTTAVDSTGAAPPPRPRAGKRVRTPTLLQIDAVECGAAALGIVLAYYKRFVPLAELRQECGVSRDGSKASSILKAARRYGLDCEGYKKEVSELSDIKAPFIVFWNFNHFLVVEGFGTDVVYLNDPAAGPRKVTYEEFNKSFTGVVLELKPSATFKPGGRPFKLLSALAARLTGNWGAVGMLFLAGMLIAIPSIALPLLLQMFIDEVVTRQNSAFFKPLLFSLLVLLVLRTCLHGLQLALFRRLNLALSVRMSGAFLWHVLRLPSSFFSQRYAGEIADRVRLNDHVAGFLTEEFGNIAIQVVILFLFAFVMFLFDPWLTALAVFFAVLNVLALAAMQRQRKDDNMRLQREEGRATAAALGSIVDIETMKAAGQEDALFLRWAGAYTKALNLRQLLGVSSYHLAVLPLLLSLLTSGVVLVVGGLRVMDGYMTLGMLVAFQGLLTEFNRPIAALVDLGGRFQMLTAHLNRLDDVLDNEEDKNVLAAERGSSQWQNKETWLSCRLELKDLSFGYNPCGDPLIDKFNLTLLPGERIALVGGSGSGKSTVSRLVAGLMPPWQGEILFDKLPKSAIPGAIFSRSVTMVEQSIFLFRGTVKENLTLWDETIPAEDIVNACKDAEIWEDIQRLPGGLNSMLLEGGANLSGGQRQRLEIARSLVCNPRLLILDEATSALDAETERLIDLNLRRRGCSCLIVAHRLSTIRDCNEILVLERGEIIERGTHNQLCEKKGLYHRLMLGDAVPAEEGTVSA